MTRKVFSVVSALTLVVVLISCSTPKPTGLDNTSSNTGNTTQPKPAVSQKTETASEPYIKMLPEKQQAFVSEQARIIARQMSNRDYAFTDDFLKRIKPFVDSYVRRVGNGSDKMWAEDLNRVVERGAEAAPVISRAFNQRGVSPLMGIYLPMVETEYHNIEAENFAGAAGMFHMIAPFVMKYGLDPKERTDVEKTADVAARYLNDNMKMFESDQMKEALAILGYGRSPTSVQRDLQKVLTEENKSCSICALTANAKKLDIYFQSESIKHVPKFFAAAIVGENPQAFGLKTKPLSSY